MISEGSCDTEDWSNNADSIMLDLSFAIRNKYNLKIYSNRKKKVFKIVIIYYSHTIFEVIKNSALLIK